MHWVWLALVFLAILSCSAVTVVFLAAATQVLTDSPFCGQASLIMYLAPVGYAAKTTYHRLGGHPVFWVDCYWSIRRPWLRVDFGRWPRPLVLQLGAWLPPVPMLPMIRPGRAGWNSVDSHPWWRKHPQTLTICVLFHHG